MRTTLHNMFGNACSEHSCYSLGVFRAWPRCRAGSHGEEALRGSSEDALRVSSIAFFERLFGSFRLLSTLSASFGLKTHCVEPIAHYFGDRLFGAFVLLA